jgi:tight adherence protein B
MIPLLAALATAGAIVLFGLQLSRRRQSRPNERRLQRLSEAPEPPKKTLSWDEVRRRGPSSLPLFRDGLLQSDWAKKTALELEAAGLSLRTGEYLIIRGACALAGFVAVLVIVRSGYGLLFAVVGAAIGFILPRYWVRSVRSRRVEAVNKQLPEATQMIANALRAGFAFQHGVTMVSEQMEPPIADEFVRMAVDVNVGASLEEALLGLLARSDTEEMNLLVTAVLVQRTSGGNLSEILDNVGDHLREKERLVGEVRTMTAQQRFSGMVLTSWPAGLLVLFALFNWSQTSLLFTTGLGLSMLGIGIVLQLMGFLTIRRILDIEV